MFAGNYAPRDWAFCDGQLLKVIDFPELFNAVGNMYGSDGKTTFALPDMRGRIAVHRGNGFKAGETGGSELADIAAAHVPVHEHTSIASSAGGGSTGAAVNAAIDPQPLSSFSLNGNAFAAGSNNAHENMQPFLSIHFIIALDGDAEPVSLAEPFIGEIRIFAGRAAPAGWRRCDGQSLQIEEHPELFATLGTTYGGDGGSAFALPDLRSRAALHAGQGDGLTLRKLGESGGSAEVVLSENQLPYHSHQLVDSVTGGTLLVSEADGSPAWNSILSTGQASAETTAGEPHNNLQPYLVLNYLIATRGNTGA